MYVWTQQQQILLNKTQTEFYQPEGKYKRQHFQRG